MNTTSYKIAIIGSPDAVSGFRAVGCEAFGVTDIDQATQKITEIYNGDQHAVLFITEDWYEKMKLFIKELPAKALPALVAIPSQQGSTGAGLAALKTIVEKAVGSDILSDH